MTGADAVRILLVTQRELVTLGFRLLLEDEPWVERVIVAEPGEPAVALALSSRAGVAVVEEGVRREACLELKRRVPGLRIVMLETDRPVAPERVRASGASGHISWEWPAAELITAIRIVSAGMTLFADRTSATATSLSWRELEIMRLIAAGATNPEIGESMYLSVSTVKQDASAVYRKLGVRNRAEAVQRAQRLGLV